MEFATHYDVGDRKRGGGINEDSVAVSVFEQGHRDGMGRAVNGHRPGPVNRSVAVFALADGAGGYEAGDAASYVAATTVCEHLADVAVRAAASDPSPFDVPVDGDVVPDGPDPATIRAAVEEAIESAHRAVVDYAAANGTSAYTTIVAGLCVDGACHYGWVGDSRAYLVNDVHEQVELITKDHNVVQRLQDEGRIDDVESHVHPRGNEITRALGGSATADPADASVAVDTNSVPVYAEDTLLVTSDGLPDAQTDAPELYDLYVETGRTDAAADTVREAVVTDDEIRDVVLAADALDDAATDLVEMANERGGKDNLSTILLRDETLAETPDSPPARSLGSVEDRETVIVKED